MKNPLTTMMMSTICYMTHLMEKKSFAVCGNSVNYNKSNFYRTILYAQTKFLKYFITFCRGSYGFLTAVEALPRV